MNQRRKELGPEYRKGRKRAFLDSGGRCVKCGRMAYECHHVYGIEDNAPEHLRPLCYWCHAVAPVEDAYWPWEQGGESGPDRMIREVKPMVRALAMEIISGDEFSKVFDGMAVGVIDLIAELKRKAGAERTSDALQAKKKRGERMGNTAYGFQAGGRKADPA